MAGFKNKIAPEQALTGEGLCEILELDYQTILNRRAGDRQINFDSFLNDLLEDEEIRDKLKSMLIGKDCI